MLVFSVWYALASFYFLFFLVSGTFGDLEKNPEDTLTEKKKIGLNIKTTTFDLMPQISRPKPVTSNAFLTSAP